MPRLFTLSVPLFLICFLLQAKAPDPTKATAYWAQWRGPSGQGYCDDKKVPLTWSEKENVLWKINLPGQGNSTPIIWGERIFLTAAGEKGKDRYVLCVSRKEGKILWKQLAASDVALEKTHGWNGYASPSCATDGKYVFAFFGTPGLFCYDMEGKLIWKRNFGIFRSDAGWGTAASPFLFEDLVIQNCDNDGGQGAAPSNLVAMDKATGKIVWSTPRNQGRGFSTPRLMKMADGRIDLVLNGPAGVWGYDPKTGKEQWHCSRFDAGDKHKFGEPIPVDDGQHIFISSGRPGPYQILKMPGKGDVTRTHIVHSGVRTTHRDVSSTIVWQGRVYAVDSKAILSCYDLSTGKELSTMLIGNRRNRSLGSPIAINGKLLWILDDGMTVVVEPGATPKIVGRNKLDGENLDYGASPAVADGKIYLRSQQHLYCIGTKE